MHGVIDRRDVRPNSTWLLAFLAVAPVVASSLIGSAATTPNLAPWYASLVKPPFNPPNWVFGPVWTVLDIMIAYSFYRILRLPASSLRARAIMVFMAQIALNTLWSVAFFGLQSPGYGLIVIIPFLLLIAATIYLFAELDNVAAALLAPYLLWVSFATLLNIAIFILN